MPFAPAYITNVLSENFEDAKVLFFSPLMSIHYAHLVMLRRQGIVSAETARVVRDALDRVEPDAVRAAVFDGSVEDLFCYVERLVIQASDEERAGRLHTARSRNDIDMTMYRMRQREALLDLAEAALTLRRALQVLAEAHRHTLFAAHTHTQPAQPSTIAHYLLAVIEQLERDGLRLAAAFASTNRCPLGACAITGTGFPIDRKLTSELLGFDGPTGNTYGSIATVDYLLESTGATSVMLVGLGRVLQDLLLWCTDEFGYLRLADGYVQGSSIMPQKRNPVALEHARALTSKAFGQAQAVAAALHNTPFGDVVDTEDDIQPLVLAVFADATRAIRLMSAAMSGASLDGARMADRAAAGGITLTELADMLVREQGLSFCDAHEIAARLSGRVTGGPDASLAEALASASREVTGKSIEMSDQRLHEVLSAGHFVSVRITPGGPAPEETKRALAEAAVAIGRDAGWLLVRRAALAAAAARLAERSARL